MKRIAIIGCGWLGFPAAKKLLQQGHEVHGTTTSKEKVDLFQRDGIIPHLVDLRKPNQNLSFLANCDSVLISFPPGLRQNKEDYPKQIDQLIEGLRRYIIQHIVFISSTSVYPPEGVFDENTSISVSSDRQKILLETELVLLDSFDATVIRMGGLYGENRSPDNFIKSESQLETNQEINFMHQRDAVNLTTALLNTNKPGVFNGVHPHHPLKFEFYKECYKKAGKDFSFKAPITTNTRIINSKRMNEIDFSFEHESHYNYLNS